MKFTTLTSSLVLSLLLVGPQAIAMETETEGTNATPRVAPETLTASDWLRESRMDFGLFETLAKGHTLEATEEDKRLAEAAILRMKNDALEKKKSTTPIAEPALLAPEQEKTVSSFWSLNWNWFWSTPQPTENTTSTTPVATTPDKLLVNEATDEGKFTPTAYAALVEKPSNNKIKITTNHNEEANYQLESTRIPVEAGEKMRVPYEIIVEDGGIMSLGFLNTMRNGWYGEELILSAGEYRGTYERIVPEGETVTSLVFRNYHLGTAGQSTFTIEGLKIEKEGKPTTESL